ncbi:MAG TPA: SpoIIE family protein phosphatase [Blastocatellia bacterium]|nr:SpoIIE family protein phosphatase [Blastocatellia bacterium]
MAVTRTPDERAPVSRALIADDQPDILEALYLLLKGEGFQVETVTSPAAVLEALRARDFDLLLMDLNYARDTTSGQEGLDLLENIQAIDNTLPIVVMTAWATVDLAVEAMRRGVRDFVQKPWENDRLLSILCGEISDGRSLRSRLRRQRQESEDAREIQRGLLPKEIPRVRGCEISTSWLPALNVSGDYFDIFRFREDRVGLCIADVSGKGLPAALLMCNVQAAVKAFVSEHMSPRELCGKLNRVIHTNTASERFITFFYCVVDTHARKLVYANAGHCPPIIVRADGTRVRLEEGGALLGPFPDWDYEQRQVELRPGDKILLFTDGVTEALDSEGADFGEERLVELLIKNRGASASEVQERLIEAISEFTGGSFTDDVTSVVLSVD